MGKYSAGLEAAKIDEMLISSSFYAYFQVPTPTSVFFAFCVRES
jgi:hypothetical protein